MWGVMFELEVRLVLPPTQSSGGPNGVSPAHTWGSSQPGGGLPGDMEAGGAEAGLQAAAEQLLAGGRLDLQEEIYGPFYGQVGWEFFFFFF